MSVVTKEQADTILAELRKPNRCDCCGRGFDDRVKLTTADYGPFELYVCQPCNWRIALNAQRRRKTG